MDTRAGPRFAFIGRSSRKEAKVRSCISLSQAWVRGFSLLGCYWMAPLSSGETLLWLKAWFGELWAVLEERRHLCIKHPFFIEVPLMAHRSHPGAAAPSIWRRQRIVQAVNAAEAASESLWMDLGLFHGDQNVITHLFWELYIPLYSCKPFTSNALLSALLRPCRVSGRAKTTSQPGSSKKSHHTGLQWGKKGQQTPVSKNLTKHY